jgi:hypothetical protein
MPGNGVHSLDIERFQCLHQLIRDVDHLPSHLTSVQRRGRVLGLYAPLGQSRPPVKVGHM